MSKRSGFGDCPEPATSLIQHSIQDCKLFTKACYHIFLAHTLIISHNDKTYICVGNLFTDGSLGMPSAAPPSSLPPKPSKNRLPQHEDGSGCEVYPTVKTKKSDN